MSASSSGTKDGINSELQDIMNVDPVEESAGDVYNLEIGSESLNQKNVTNPSGSTKGTAKGKATASRREPKVDRQGRSYIVTSSDLTQYQTRHRVSDPMFKHYLSKRIGFESSKKGRRLNKQEVKKLFPLVRALCFELLATVRTKRSYNVEKKIVMTSLHKSTNSNIKWSEIVKGRKTLPPVKKDILITAKDDKIQRQSTEINILKSRLIEKETLISNQAKSIANLSDRIKALEDKERNRKKKDPFSDRKKLANSGSVLCHVCLPPVHYMYKKTLTTKPSEVHCQVWDVCVNCTRRSVFLSAGKGLPLVDCKNDGSDVYFYPEGHTVLDQYQLLSKNDITVTKRYEVLFAIRQNNLVHGFSSVEKPTPNKRLKRAIPTNS